MQRHLTLALGAVAATVALTGCGSMMSPSNNLPTATGDTRPEPMVMLVPIQLTNKALEAGCWVQLYDERNFSGEFMTLVGPADLQSPDKGTGRQLKRHVDSLVTGPKATLKVFEHSMFKDRTVTFGPNSREGGLMTKLGFGGDIQSLQLECDS